MHEYRRVLAFAHVLTADRGVAEDLVQDAFLTAMESWDSIRNPSAWIRQVVANAARSGWRRRQAEGRALAKVGEEDRVFGEVPEETDRFWRTVSALPRRQAQVVALFYLEDRSLGEIAELLGCSESTARGHLSRGRRSLADRLGAEL